MSEPEPDKPLTLLQKTRIFISNVFYIFLSLIYTIPMFFVPRIATELKSGYLVFLGRRFKKLFIFLLPLELALAVALAAHTLNLSYAWAVIAFLLPIMWRREGTIADLVKENEKYNRLMWEARVERDELIRHMGKPEGIELVKELRHKHGWPMPPENFVRATEVKRKSNLLDFDSHFVESKDLD